LFGGRGDNNEDMINSIEEYDVLNNIWTIINVTIPFYILDQSQC